MKIRNIYSNGVGLLLATSLMISCQSSTQEVANSETEIVSTPSEVLTFKNELHGEIYNAYIQLKNALVETNNDNAAAAAALLAEALKKADMVEEHEIAQTLATTSEIKDKRKEFTLLSTKLISKFKAAEISKGKIFVQHCPMANSGDGGDWLASESNIRNPYYGDEMMECGSVIEEIKSI